MLFTSLVSARSMRSHASWSASSASACEPRIRVAIACRRGRCASNASISSHPRDLVGRGGDRCQPNDVTGADTMLMTARITSPAFAVDGAMDALNAMAKAISRARVPIPREFVHLRASQINGCSVCVDMHAKAARSAGESEERVFAVAAWRETPYFSDAERAALALTEAVTRVADRAEQVPDPIWDAAAEHFDEAQLGALVLDIAVSNLWNRLNVATQQIVGELGG